MLCGDLNGKEIQKRGVIAGSLCFTTETNNPVKQLSSNKNQLKVGCMRQVLGPGALGRPRGIRWRGRWEGGSGWGIHVNPWLIHVNV